MPPDRQRLLLLVPPAETGNYRELLQAAALPGLELVLPADVDEARRRAPECTLLLGVPARVAEVLDAATRLRWVQSTYAGVEALCRPGLRRDYLLTGIKGVFGPLVREYVFGWILALERQLFATRVNQRRGRWEPLPYRGLGGQRLGVAGLGSLGRAVVDSANHFGMRVRGFRSSPGECPGVERVYAGGEWPQFLAGLDYLVLALPHTAATTGLVDAAALACLPRGAVLVNVGRGSAVVEQELAAALASGALRAAVLDVFATEPLPAESPLWRLENAYLTPHNAALSFPEAIVGVFADNYRRFVAGQPLQHAVDFERGY